MLSKIIDFISVSTIRVSEQALHLRNFWNYFYIAFELQAKTKSNTEIRNMSIFYVYAALYGR